MDKAKKALGKWTRGNQAHKAAKILILLIALITPPNFSAFAQSDDYAQNGNTDGQDPNNQIAASHGSELTWLKSVQPALAQAGQSNRLVLVDLYTDWCGWCKKLDKDTYANPQVAQFVASHFVTVRMNAEDGGEGQSLATQLKVRGYPCTVILDASGKYRGRAYGYFTPQEFPDKLTKISTGQSVN